MNKQKFKTAIVKASRAMYRSLPIILGVLILISLANVLVPKNFYTILFRGNLFLDPFIGSLLGSILAGNPITSYIISGELLKQGISLIAVTAFIVSWVTVGIIQLPAEIMLLGKKFAITRNVTAFFLAIIVAIITILILNLF